MIAGVFPVALLLTGAFILISCSTQIGMLMEMDKTPISLSSGAIGKETLLKIVYVGIGIFVIANAIPKLTQAIITTVIQRNTGISTNTWVSFVSIGMQLLIGTFLFLKAKEKS
ncbi:MAG: hypothetical protein GX036_10905 [Firmicutes bacterium]|nr:hypothetical protein [Bacillota bacterium]